MTNQNALKPLAPHAHAPAETACCGNSACGSTTTAPIAAVDTADVPKGALLFRIPTMDCAVEESEIRRALEPVRGISGLRFRLGERTMAITADEAALPDALAAIRKAGFKPEPLNDVAGGQPAAGGTARATGFMTPELLRLVAALDRGPARADRAGRAERPGRALLQTWTPEHPVMQALKAQVLADGALVCPLFQ